MAYIPVNKKTGAAIAKELEKLMQDADMQSVGDGRYPFYYGYINSGLKTMIAQLKIGGILIADKK